MGARSEDEALGIFMHSVRRRWLGQRDVRWLSGVGGMEPPLGGRFSFERIGG